MESETENREKVLYDIASYLRIIAASSVKSRAGDVIDKWEKAMVYSKMDGNTSAAKIAGSLNVPARTVANWAEDFLHYHLVTAPSKYNSSHKALFSLEELGIDIASLKRQHSKASADQDTAVTENVGESDMNGTQNTQ